MPGEVAAPANALKPYADFKDGSRPQDGQTYARMVESGAWVQDFTHLWFQGMWVYVATILDLKTRRIVGWSVSLHHDTELVHRAVLDVLSKYPAPPILHSDQGSEILELPATGSVRQAGDCIVLFRQRQPPGKMGSRNGFTEH